MLLLSAKQRYQLKKSPNNIYIYGRTWYYYFNDILVFVKKYTGMTYNARASGARGLMTEAKVDAFFRLRV